MVSVTVSIPERTRALMKQFPEMNWSGWVRDSIEKKAEELCWKEKALKKLKQEEAFSAWSLDLGRKAKKGRLGKMLAQLPLKERKEILK